MKVTIQLGTQYQTICSTVTEEVPALSVAVAHARKYVKEYEGHGTWKIFDELGVALAKKRGSK